ncbi:2-oxoacid:ferredoxin oxidoreductase subunit gamma [Desulfosporosinus burensis]
MAKYEIRFGGFGGQGVVLAGVVLAKSASLEEGKNAVQTQLYGPDSRGGGARSEVVISEQKVDYPKVGLADLLVLLSQEAAEKYSSELKEEAIIIYDPDLVKLDNGKSSKQYAVPATKIAQNLGVKIAANMVMLGAVVAASNIVSLESLLKVIASSVPTQAKESNLSAAKEGFSCVEVLKGGRGDREN